VLPALFISFVLAIAFGFATFSAHSGNARNYALDGVFGLTVAVFLGMLLSLIMRRALSSLRSDGDLRQTARAPRVKVESRQK
jgi:hypothetical protein